MKLSGFKRLAIGAAAILLAACGAEQSSGGEQAAAPQQTFEWKLVTTWPKNFPGLGTTPEKFAKAVNEMSDGRLKIKVYGAGEVVPAMQVFDAVQTGASEMGHGAAYYWKGKIPAAQFFTAIPFGMNVQETNGWFHYGGGLELWQEVYQPYGLIPMAGGNTGVQMAGWFKKEINSIEDLKGLKMRIPGLAGEVLKKVGGVPVTLPGGELFTALQTGAIDATEWVGPYNDRAFGLHKAANFYYVSGWHEPGAALEFLINEEAFNQLPADLQAIVKYAGRMANADMLDQYTAANNQALKQLIADGVQVKRFPADVVNELKKASAQVVADMVADDPIAKKVYESYDAFLQQAREYHQISEFEYYKNRDGQLGSAIAAD